MGNRVRIPSITAKTEEFSLPHTTPPSGVRSPPPGSGILLLGTGRRRRSEAGWLAGGTPVLGLGSSLQGATVSCRSPSWNGPTSARRLKAWWWCRGHSPARDTLVLPSSRLAADPERRAEDTGDAGTRRRDLATKGKAGRAPAKSPRPGREIERKRERGDRQTEPASARVELCI